MIKQWINLLHETFWITPFVAIPLLIITFTAVTFIILMSIAFFLDSSDNRVSKYPFNIIFDRILPLITCLCPTLIITLLNPINTSWFGKFGYIILLHLFLLIPLMHFWSYHRHWQNDHSKHHYVYWNQPVLYKHLSIAFIYPACWGFYFSLNRYYRLGKKIDISDLISSLNVDLLTITLFLLPFLIPWIMLSISLFNEYRFWFWYNFTSIINVIHLFLLKYYSYFKFCEKLRKFSFIVGKYISLSNDIYPINRSYYKFRYLLKYFYMKPWICVVALTIFISSELLLTQGKLNYSLYLIFWYPLLYAIFYLLFTFYTMDFVQDVCNVDYFLKNWEHPRYPKLFWASFYDNELRYGFNWDLTIKEQQQVKVFCKRYTTKNFPPLFTLPHRVQHHPYCFRLKAAYKTSFGVRWVHTSIEHSLHSATGYFVRSLLERIALIQHSWRPHYALLEIVEKKSPINNTIAPWYLHFEGPTSNNIRTILEHNFKTNFLPLIKKGIIVTQYEKNIKIDTMPKNQTEPDVVINMSESSFLDKRIHGIDQKSGTSSAVSSHGYSQMNSEVYVKRMRRFISTLNYHHPELANTVAKALDQLCKSCNDFHLHQLVWASNLHLFPNNFIPPMRIPHNFSIQDCRPEFLILFNKAQLKVQNISNYLYIKKIPEMQNVSDPLSQSALDLFNDSELQKILGS